MQYKLTPQQEELRQLFRKVVKEKIAPGAQEREEKGEYPWDLVKVFQENNFYAVSIPDKYGGKGGKIFDFCLLVEEVSKVCNNAAAMLGFCVLGPYPILIGASEEMKMKYLPKMAKGEWLGAYALTEPNAGSDAASLTSTGVLDPRTRQYTVNGQKCFISNFDVATLCPIFVRTDPEAKPAKGISALVWEKEPNKIPKEVKYFRSMPKMSMAAMQTFEFTVENVKIPADNIIGKEGDGFTIAMKVLDRGRLNVAAQGLGTAQGALDLAVEYARTRKQFGVPIGSFQGLQFMLADMAMQVEAARQLLYMCAAHADENGPNVRFYGAMAKCFATDMAMKVTTDALQIFGGYGFIRDLPLQRLMRDTKAMQIYEGTSQVQRIIIARGLLGKL